MARELLAAALILISTGCSAQEKLDSFSGSVSGQGVVSGHVYNCCPQQGVASMKVTFSGDRKTVVVVRSDATGAYTARLPAGAYDAYIGEGGQPFDQGIVSIRAGETRHLDFRIRSAAIG